MGGLAPTKLYNNNELDLPKVNMSGYLLRTTQITEFYFVYETPLIVSKK